MTEMTKESFRPLKDASNLSSLVLVTSDVATDVHDVTIAAAVGVCEMLVKDLIEQTSVGGARKRAK